MNQYTCTCNTNDYLWRAVCVAKDEDAARELAAGHADWKWWGYGLAELKQWNVALAEKSVAGPARIVDSTYYDH